MIRNCIMFFFIMAGLVALWTLGFYAVLQWEQFLDTFVPALFKHQFLT